jgi:mannose/fructose/N-acetylgalactosamine-specific phosphotransferase system component IIC
VERGGGGLKVAILLLPILTEHIYIKSLKKASADADYGNLKEIKRYYCLGLLPLFLSMVEMRCG